MDNAIGHLQWLVGLGFLICLAAFGIVSKMFFSRLNGLSNKLDLKVDTKSCDKTHGRIRIETDKFETSSINEIKELSRIIIEQGKLFVALSANTTALEKAIEGLRIDLKNKK